MDHRISLDGYAYRLRPIRLSDAEFILRVRLEDKERNRFIHEIPNDVSVQEEWLRAYLERPDDYYFVIENKMTAQPEGLIAIYNFEGNGRAEWGRWVVQKGSFASVESVNLIYRVAFEKLGLAELCCRTIRDNTAVVSFHDSIREKTKGILKDYCSIGDQSFDAVEQYAEKAYFYDTVKPDLDQKSCTIFLRNLRVETGGLQFHHIGVAAKNIGKELAAFRMLGYREEGAVFEDKSQGIRGLFLTAKGQPRLELLENLEGSDTLTPFIDGRVKMYHMGYCVSNIEHAVEVLTRCRVPIVSPLKQSVYFGKRICFLMLPNLYMIELIET